MEGDEERLKRIWTLMIGRCHKDSIAQEGSERNECVIERKFRCANSVRKRTA